MNYAKIQEILESENAFRNLVAARNTKVVTRGGGEAMYSAMTVQVAEGLQARRMDDKAGNRPIVIALAMQLNRASGPTVAPPAPLPVKPKVVTPEEETVKVKAVPSPALQADPARQQQQQLTAFVDRGDIIRYQSAVAISQLLAAVYQLAESDTWPGYEGRKKLLGDLLDEYETVSKQHVNLSVKQLTRAKA